MLSPGTHRFPPSADARHRRRPRLCETQKGKGGGGSTVSGRETLLDKTLCSRFTMLNLLLFRLCDFSWFKRTVVESSREVGV